MEIIFLWGLIIAIGGWIGSKKGHTSTGIVWALLLGPIGWIITATTKARWVCPACKEAITKGALKCKHCQTELSWEGDKAQIKPH